MADDAAHHTRTLCLTIMGLVCFFLSSQDTVLNENWSSLINFCHQAGLRIDNGRVGEMLQCVSVRM